MDQRVGDWAQTFLGKKNYMMDPRPEDMIIEDIAHHLATIFRYGGGAREPYSVAEHCVRASYLVPLPLALETLMHDAAEARMGADVTRPVKRSGLLGALWQDAENRNQKAIHEAFGLPTENRFGMGFYGHDIGAMTISFPVMEHVMPAEVKHADTVMLMTEKRDLMSEPPAPWVESGIAPLTETIVPWAWHKAESEFLRRFHTLYRSEKPGSTV